VGEFARRSVFCQAGKRSLDMVVMRCRMLRWARGRGFEYGKLKADEGVQGLAKFAGSWPI
jgi:hypothetical protein